MSAAADTAPGPAPAFTVPTGYAIRVASARDVEAWLDTIDAQHRENGADGFYVAPYSPRESRPPRSAERVEQYALRVEMPPPLLGWMRIWLAYDQATGAVAGQANLAGQSLLAESHRCTLGMGLLRAHHRRGLGTALLAHAIAWARSVPSLAWIDLGVFSGNLPAQGLYRKMGFVQTGRTPDRFRVDGASVDDIQMVLAV